MSKCVKCGNEILTGDIHWEMGLCNNCYNELYKDHKTHISLDKMWLKLAQDFRDENEKLQDKVADLEAKLAEKEKQLENAQNLKAIEVADELSLKLSKIHNQDKISFAVEQLEKVKGWCENHKFSDEYDYVIAYEPDEEDASGCVDYLKEHIDNQISKLK